MELHADHVPHGASGDEQGGFLAGDLGGALFEAVDGGIFAVDVISDFGFGHGATHGFGGTGYGVAAEIDKAHAFRNSPSTSLETITPLEVRRKREPS